MQVLAHAKINLGLEILAQREDGFHALETVFHRIDLADAIVIERTALPGIALHCDAADLPCDARNLAYRAAAAYLALRPRGGVRIALCKRIPAGAGLGGGSADAAAVLRALSDSDEAPLDAGALHRLAANLGSDVPFFLHSACAHGLGRGDELTPLPALPPLPITVLMPVGAHCATPAVFAGLTAAERGPRAARGAASWAQALAGVRCAADLAPLLSTPLSDRLLMNRLTASAIRLCPSVGELLAWVRTAYPSTPALMTGSGAACVAFAHLPLTAVPQRFRAWHAALAS